MIEAVIFDMDDTIFYPQLPFQRAIKKVFSNFVGDVSKAYVTFREISDDLFDSVLDGDWTIPYFQAARICETMKKIGYEETTLKDGHEFQRIYEEEQEKVQMLDGIRETLDYLREQGIKIAIITNGPTKHQLKKIEKLGIYEYVSRENVIVSQETGFSKPDREIFDLAAKRFSIDPQKALYIGDNFHNDIFGAAASGWQALWINHRNLPVPNGMDEVKYYEIKSHKELLNLMKRLIEPEI